jgi:hypothetical protein
MGEDLGRNAEAETESIETLSETCKGVAKNWPIQIAWKTSAFTFRGKALGPFFVVKVDRKRPKENQEKLLSALGPKTVLMDDEGYYAPFTEPMLNLIKEHIKRDPPEVVWRSSQEKAKIKASRRGKR